MSGLKSPKGGLLEAIHLYRKVPRDLTDATRLGGVLSLLCAVLIGTGRCPSQEDQDLQAALALSMGLPVPGAAKEEDKMSVSSTENVEKQEQQPLPTSHRALERFPGFVQL